MIERVCLENGYYYIENGNVYENYLFEDGLHLCRKTNMVSKYRSARDSSLDSATGKSDLQTLHGLRFEYPKKMLCGFLNINSLRNKIHDLRLIIHNVPLYYFGISETKLFNSFPNTHLTINNYEIRTRRDRDKHEGGLVEFVWKGLIRKKLRKY